MTEAGVRDNEGKMLGIMTVREAEVREDKSEAGRG